MAYACTTFRVDPDEEGQGGKTINAGDEISASDIKVSDEEFQRLIDTGAISEEEPKLREPTPTPMATTVSLEDPAPGDERELDEKEREGLEGEPGGPTQFDNLSTLASGADMPEPGSSKPPESLTQDGESPTPGPQQTQPQQTQGIPPEQAQG